MNIGVNGASGHLGSAVVKELQARSSGNKIVAISRSPQKTPQGAEGRYGDYDDATSLQEAYKGLDRLFLITSTSLVRGQQSKQLCRAIDVASAAGVKHICLVSSVGARRLPETDKLSSYFETEQHLMRVARNWSVFRMGYYAETFAEEALWALPYGVLVGLGESRIALTSCDDLAAAAAGLLLGDGHDGAIYNVTGPVALSGPERAAAVAEASGQPMIFSIIAEDSLIEIYKQTGLDQESMDLYHDIQRHSVLGDYNIVTGDMEKLAGHAPRPLSAVLAKTFNVAEGGH